MCIKKCLHMLENQSQVYIDLVRERFLLRSPSTSSIPPYVLRRRFRTGDEAASSPLDTRFCTEVLSAFLWKNNFCHDLLVFCKQRTEISKMSSNKFLNILLWHITAKVTQKVIKVSDLRGTPAPRHTCTVHQLFGFCTQSIMYTKAAAVNYPWSIVLTSGICISCGPQSTVL